jgi:hypothetical protein
MLYQHVACLPVQKLVCKNLLVNSPQERLANQIFYISDAFGLVGIFGIIGVDNAHEMFFSQTFKVEQQFLEQVELLLLFWRHTCKKTGKAVDHNHAEVKVAFLFF